MTSESYPASVSANVILQSTTGIRKLQFIFFININLFNIKPTTKPINLSPI